MGSDNIPPVRRATGPRERQAGGDPLTGQYRVQVLDRAVAILRSLADADAELTAVEIARAVGLHKSTVHRLLVVLEHHRLVQRGDGSYRLGTGLLELGEKASARLTLGERAGPCLRDLSAATGEGAHVTVLSDTEMLSVAHVEGRWSLQSLTRTGQRTQIHSTAAGKAVLAFLAPDLVDGLIARLPFTRLTRRTIVTPAAFKLELMRVRDAGYAMDDEEFEDGLRCVGAPIFDHRGNVVASISVAAPVFRLGRDRLALVIRLVIEAAQRLSTEIGYQGPAVPQQPAARSATARPRARRS
jgi:DNA-binding IclR family transcriptional regulator